MLPEYLPWSKNVMSDAVNSIQKGEFIILDLELSARCSLRAFGGGCVYCDSASGKPHSGEINSNKMEELLHQAASIGIKWLHICGLGEPKDDPKLKEIIATCGKLKINISMFSNGIEYSDSFIDYLFDNKVNLLIKCDSFSQETFNEILGEKRHSGIANSIYSTIHRLGTVGYTQEAKKTGYTSLALSIVPTRKNLSEIKGVIEYCQEHHIFPLIGQLENSGLAKARFNELHVSQSELINLKNEIEQITKQLYEIPVCPAGIGGIHINNIGDCVLEKLSGLSCPWFLLEEPTLVTLGNVRECTLSELTHKIINYRKNCKTNIPELIRQCSHSVFGGCGGKDLLEYYNATI